MVSLELVPTITQNLIQLLSVIGLVCLITMIIFSRIRPLKWPNRRVKDQRAEDKKAAGGQANFDGMKELMVRPQAEEAKLERMKAYIERPTQKLLRALLEKGTGTEIIPTYDPTVGFRYSEVESTFDRGPSPSETESFIERLHQLEILSESFYETISVCPSCSSSILTLHYKCAKCGSHHIVKTSLTEHIPCGHIGEKEEYYKANTNPVCPKCSAFLVESETRDMGLWYSCRNCNEKFEQPQLELTCRKCGNEFPVKTANTREISKYRLNPDKEQEIRQNVTSLESIEALLIDLGFSVETAVTATGEKSGIQHNFSLVATKQVGGHKILIAVDHAVENVEVGAPPLILFAFKISEVKVDLPVFIAIPKLSETAKRIAQGYGILVIEGLPKEKDELSVLCNEIERRLIPEPARARVEDLQWTLGR